MNFILIHYGFMSVLLNLHGIFNLNIKQRFILGEDYLVEKLTVVYNDNISNNLHVELKLIKKGLLFAKIYLNPTFYNSTIKSVETSINKECWLNVYNSSEGIPLRGLYHLAQFIKIIIEAKPPFINNNPNFIENIYLYGYIDEQFQTCKMEPFHKLDITSNASSSEMEFNHMKALDFDHSNPNLSISGWCPFRNDEFPWLEFEFNSIMKITKIMILDVFKPILMLQRRIYLSYSYNGAAWINYTLNKDINGAHIFSLEATNQTRKNVFNLTLEIPILAEYLRIHLLKSKEIFCLQAQIYGCPLVIDYGFVQNFNEFWVNNQNDDVSYVYEFYEIQKIKCANVYVEIEGLTSTNNSSSYTVLKLETTSELHTNIQQNYYKHISVKLHTYSSKKKDIVSHSLSLPVEIVVQKLAFHLEDNSNIYSNIQHINTHSRRIYPEICKVECDRNSDSILCKLIPTKIYLRDVRIKWVFHDIFMNKYSPYLLQMDNKSLTNKKTFYIPISSIRNKNVTFVTFEVYLWNFTSISICSDAILLNEENTPPRHSFLNSPVKSQIGYMDIFVNRTNKLLFFEFSKFEHDSYNPIASYLFKGDNALPRESQSKSTAYYTPNNMRQFTFNSTANYRSKGLFELITVKNKNCTGFIFDYSNYMYMENLENPVNYLILLNHNMSNFKISLFVVIDIKGVASNNGGILPELYMDQHDQFQLTNHSKDNQYLLDSISVYRQSTNQWYHKKVNKFIRNQIPIQLDDIIDVKNENETEWIVLFKWVIIMMTNPLKPTAKALSSSPIHFKNVTPSLVPPSLPSSLLSSSKGKVEKNCYCNLNFTSNNYSPTNFSNDFSNDYSNDYSNNYTTYLETDFILKSISCCSLNDPHLYIVIIDHINTIENLEIQNKSYILLEIIELMLNHLDYITIKYILEYFSIKINEIFTYAGLKPSEIISGILLNCSLSTDTLNNTQFYNLDIRQTLFRLCNKMFTNVEDYLNDYYVYFHGIPMENKDHCSQLFYRLPSDRRVFNFLTTNLTESLIFKLDKKYQHFECISSDDILDLYFENKTIIHCNQTLDIMEETLECECFHHYPKESFYHVKYLAFNDRDEVLFCKNSKLYIAFTCICGILLGILLIGIIIAIISLRKEYINLMYTIYEMICWSGFFTCQLLFYHHILGINEFLIYSMLLGGRPRILCALIKMLLIKYREIPSIKIMTIISITAQLSLMVGLFYVLNLLKFNAKNSFKVSTLNDTTFYSNYLLSNYLCYIQIVVCLVLMVIYFISFYFVRKYFIYEWKIETFSEFINQFNNISYHLFTNDSLIFVEIFRTLLITSGDILIAVFELADFQLPILYTIYLIVCTLAAADTVLLTILSVFIKNSNYLSDASLVEMDNDHIKGTIPAPKEPIIRPNLDDSNMNEEKYYESIDNLHSMKAQTEIDGILPPFINENEYEITFDADRWKKKYTPNQIQF